MDNFTKIWLIEIMDKDGDYFTKGFTFLFNDADKIKKIDPTRYRITLVPLHLGALDVLEVWKKMSTDYANILETQGRIKEQMKELADESNS